MLYEIYQLGHCLSKTEVDFRVQEEFGTVFAAARDELLELKRREVELVEKVSHLEDENRKFVEQVEKDREMVEAVNAELSKTKTELEQEKTRCTNTKEKLSLAVTKGKALVQHRDSLKQSLAEKTTELEKCLSELQEKSSALQVAKLSKEELVKSENLVASLQDMLLQRNMILEKSEEVISQSDVPKELQSMDMVERVKWLVHERNELNVVCREFSKLKEAISLIELPETVSFSDLESRLGWLKESLDQVKDEAKMLLDELGRTKEVARNEIDRLSASLLAELQEKEYVRMQLDDLTMKYEEIVQKTDKVTLEKDLMMRMLLEECGIIMEDQDVFYQTSDLTTLVNKCFGKIREKTHASFDTAGADLEMFERMQSLLYVREQELVLCEQLLEEDALVSLQMNDMSNELRVASEELGALKAEKDSLQKDLERSEEKSALLREKLSMAVKKGKGLVQDRENLKFQLDEKNSEIEKLRLNLQRQESTVSECKDQINNLLTELEDLKLQVDEKNSEIDKIRLNLQQQESIVSEYKNHTNSLSTDLERIPKLEADIVAMNDQRNQLMQFLSESNKMLQRVIESVDHIVLPIDSVFEEPVEKVNWIAGYINECKDSRMCLEQELGTVKEEAGSLASKFTEVQATMKSLEDALSTAEKKITQLAEEKRELEASKEFVQQELEKAIEEARSQTSSFAEACANSKSLEDELLRAEKNISVLTNEKEEAQGSRAAALMELGKVSEEFASQTSKLTEAYKTIKSLEDALSQVETTVASLTEKNNVVQVGRTTLESEMQKLKDEAESHTVKLANAHTTIESLEDALAKAEKDISVLEGEKRIAEEEISTLNSKLKACLEELAGTSGSLESRSVELIGHLNDLRMLVKDERLLSIVKQCCERKIEGLQDMDLVIKHIMDQVVGIGPGEPLNPPDNEGSSDVNKFFINDLDNIEIEDDEVLVADADNISSSFRKMAEGFRMRNKILADKLEGFLTFLDEFIAALLRKLQTTRDEVIKMVQSIESLNQKLKIMEVYKKEHEEAMESLENDVTMLLSACSDATRELQFEIKNDLLELNSVPELGKLNHSIFQEVREVGGGDTAEHQKKLDGSNKYLETAAKLLSSTRKAQSLSKLFESTSTVAASTIQDLQKQLRETSKAFEKAIEERDIYQNMVSKLETDADSLKDSSTETASTIQDLQKKLHETSKAFEKAIGERDLYQNMVSKLETDVDSLKDSCRELDVKVEDYQAIKEKLNEKEAEISSLYAILSLKEREAEESLLSASQVRQLFDKITGIEIPVPESEVGDVEPEISADVKKLFCIIDSVAELLHQVNSLNLEKEELESTLSTQTAEIELLKGDVETHITNKPDSEKLKSELSDLTVGLEKMINILGCDEDVVDQKSAGPRGILAVVEKQVMTLLSESENSKSKIQELGTKLLGSQKVVDELATKIKVLEDSIQVRTVEPEIVQERSISEAPSVPTGSEISEIEDPGALGKKSISPVASAAHVRSMRKGSTDHLAINIDSESARLVNNSEETDDEDKGHVFKSLNTTGLIPRQGKMVADRIDGIWVSGGRILMNRPRARLGLIAYWLFLHIWLLGTIL
ncbi:myosin-11 [Pistacia vera]|uniref:myosin-11 n=1 Tax=Pistacia vera TaxID=55513 RepID=UPI001262F2E9|nr:myosin-11 [Pistacia vera]